jgi:hypothetical protein
MNELSKILPLLIPIIILQLGLQISALVNLARRKKVRFNNKLVWVVIIIFGSMLGSIIYFVARGDEE